MLKDQVIEHEGLRLVAYKCPAGKNTVGVGRNFDDVRFSDDECRLFEDELCIESGTLDHDRICKILLRGESITTKIAHLLLDNDLKRAARSAQDSCGKYNVFFDDLPERVQDGLTNMCFQMGSCRWPGMMKDLRGKNWIGAAKNALDSRWFREQTPRRALEVAGDVANGKAVFEFASDPKDRPAKYRLRYV